MAKMAPSGLLLGARLPKEIHQADDKHGTEVPCLPQPDGVMFGIDFRHAVEFSRSGRAPSSGLSTGFWGNPVTLPPRSKSVNTRYQPGFGDSDVLVGDQDFWVGRHVNGRFDEPCGVDSRGTVPLGTVRHTNLRKTRDNPGGSSNHLGVATVTCPWGPSERLRRELAPGVCPCAE